MTRRHADPGRNCSPQASLAHAAAPSDRAGAGLGLAIVTSVADAHHGTAEAALNDPSGLRVTLTLPVAPALAVGSSG